MRADTKKRKNATQMLRATQEQEWWADQVVHVRASERWTPRCLDVGRLVAETLMYMEREEDLGQTTILRRPGFANGRVNVGRSMSVTRSCCRAPSIAGPGG